MVDAVAILFAYLIGAIPFGLIVGRIHGIADIREHGSGNIGATNVSRVLGFKAAIWVYLADIGKGILTVLIARQLTELISLEYYLFLFFVGAATVLGHVFPVYLSFKGGKGVNVALGVMVCLMPYEALLAFMVFGIVVLISRYVSLGSVCSGLAIAVIVLVERFGLHRPVPDIYVVLAVLVMIVFLVSHRQNIKRLLAGEERRLSFGNRKKDEANLNA